MQVGCCRLALLSADPWQARDRCDFRDDWEADCFMMAANGGRMTNFKSISCAILAAAFAATFFFPAAAAQEVKKKKGPPVYCTTQSDPVCARTVKGVLTTYNNDCSAKQAGAAVIARSVCDRVKCPPAEFTVCARKGGKNTSYTNSCVAEKEGAAVLLRDKCPETCADTGPPACAANQGGKPAEF